MTKAYIAGFRKAAEARGVDPDALLKRAFWPALAGFAGLAGLGAAGYGLYRTYKDFRNYRPGGTGAGRNAAPREANVRKMRTDMRNVPGLGSVQEFGNGLRENRQRQLDQVQGWGR